MTMPPPPPPPMGNYSGGYPTDYQAGPSFASWGQRVAAYFLDAIIIAIGYIPILILFALSAIPKIGILFALLAIVGYFLLAALSFYILFLTGKVGASPGKRIMGIQVVNANTGQFIGGGMGIVRAFAHIVDAIPCYIGFLFPLWDAKKQTLADKVMTTVVVAGPKLGFMDAIKAVLPTKK